MLLVEHYQNQEDEEPFDENKEKKIEELKKEKEDLIYDINLIKKNLNSF